MDTFDLKGRDIICSRGKGVLTNPGNIFYTTLISEHKANYQNALSVKEKKEVVTEVLRIIKSGKPGRRFLKPSGEDNDDGSYEQLRRDDVIKKIAQALREKPKTRKDQTKSKRRKKKPPAASAKILPVEIEDPKPSQGCHEVPDEEVLPSDTTYTLTRRKRKTVLLRRRRRDRDPKEDLTFDTGCITENTMSEFGGPAVVSNDGDEKDAISDNHEEEEIAREEESAPTMSISHNDCTEFESLGTLNPESYFFDINSTNAQDFDDQHTFDDTFFLNDFFPPLDGDETAKCVERGKGNHHGRDAESRILFSAI